MALKYTNIFHSKALHNIPKFLFLVWHAFHTTIPQKYHNFWCRRIIDDKSCDRPSIILLLLFCPMTLFLLCNTKTMHIKSMICNSIAMFSLQPYTLVGFEPRFSIPEVVSMPASPHHRAPPRVDVMITILCDFLQFSAKKLAFFSKTNVMIKFSLVSSQKRQFYSPKNSAKLSQHRSQGNFHCLKCKKCLRLFRLPCKTISDALFRPSFPHRNLKNGSLNLKV
jgi:hypothetical protein